MVRVVPISSLHPWENWVPPDLHGFYKWVFDSFEVLNGFLKQVVVSRRDVGIRKRTRWLREDLSSRPYVWLRPDFVSPSPFLVVKEPQTQSSRILVEPHLIDAEFRKAWVPFLSVGLVIPWSLLITFLVLLVIFCLRSLIWIFLGVGRWLLKSVFSLGNGLSSVEAWFSTALDIEEVLSGVGGDQLHVMVADVIKSFDTVDRSILDCTLGRLGLPDWFRRTLLITVRFALDFSWLLDLASHCVEMEVFLRVVL